MIRNHAEKLNIKIKKLLYKKSIKLFIKMEFSFIYLYKCILSLQVNVSEASKGI